MGHLSQELEKGGQLAAIHTSWNDSSLENARDEGWVGQTVQRARSLYLLEMSLATRKKCLFYRKPREVK